MSRKSRRAALRDSLARLFRAGPWFPRKERLSHCVNNLLTLTEHGDECIVPVRLWEGSCVRLDVRSATERPVYWTGCYDRHWIDSVSQCLPRGAVVVDVGANVGLWSIPLARRLRLLDGKLFAFEPSPSNFARLQQNVIDNNLAEVAACHRLALGDSTGVAPMFQDDRDGAQTGNAIVLYNDTQARISATAPMATLDGIADRLDIRACDFLKVDIEGGEYRFLRGAREFLATHQPVVLCEINPPWMERFGWSMPDLEHLASSLAYRVARPRRRQSAAGVHDVLLVPAHGNPKQQSFQSKLCSAAAIHLKM